MRHIYRYTVLAILLFAGYVFTMAQCAPLVALDGVAIIIWCVAVMQYAEGE